LHTLTTQSMSDSIYRYQSVSLSPSSQSVPSSPSHSLLTSPYCSLPFHDTSSSSSVSSIPMDVQHFLKPFTVTSGEICCHAVMIFFLWCCDPMRVVASSFLRFVDHTRRSTTVGRTPLDEWSSRRRDLYLTTHNTHNKQTSMPLVGFEPTCCYVAHYLNNTFVFLGL